MILSLHFIWIKKIMWLLILWKVQRALGQKDHSYNVITYWIIAQICSCLHKRMPDKNFGEKHTCTISLMKLNPPGPTKDPASKYPVITFSMHKNDIKNQKQLTPDFKFLLINKVQMKKVTDRLSSTSKGNATTGCRHNYNN